VFFWAKIAIRIFKHPANDSGQLFETHILTRHLFLLSIRQQDLPLKLKPAIPHQYRQRKTLTAMLLALFVQVLAIHTNLEPSLFLDPFFTHYPLFYALSNDTNPKTASSSPHTSAFSLPLCFSFPSCRESPAASETVGALSSNTKSR
jgi:hypothetical protein